MNSGFKRTCKPKAHQNEIRGLLFAQKNARGAKKWPNLYIEAMRMKKIEGKMDTWESGESFTDLKSL